MKRDWVQNCTSIYMLSRENNIRYFTAINKKRMAEEKKLSQGLEKYTVLRRDHIHKKEEVSSAVCFLPTDRQKVQTQDILFTILALSCFEIQVFY